MLDFLANNIEQLDLALEHILVGDPPNARFGLILTDNVVEITLHRLAQDMELLGKGGAIEGGGRLLHKALHRSYHHKVSFAQAVGKADAEETETLRRAHRFRNELYHIGLQHEAVLPVVAKLHHEVACRVVGRYTPVLMMWVQGKKLPQRAWAHFGEARGHEAIMAYYRTACAKLGRMSPLEPMALSGRIADHLDEIVRAEDEQLEMISTARGRSLTRDEAVLDTMIWGLALSRDERDRGELRNWPGGKVAELAQWIARHCKLPLHRDPIGRWKRCAQSLREESNPHIALRRYRGFMDRTAKARQRFEDARVLWTMHKAPKIEAMRAERACQPGAFDGGGLGKESRVLSGTQLNT